jgi:asparagine synthetase B (glutamine-hydrolysing)
VTLSGGLDSRALLGCAVGQGASLRAYTFGVPGARDVAYAARLARSAGVAHRTLAIEPSFLPRWLDHALEVVGGAVGAIHFHILSLCEPVAAESELVLDGLGGDALTGAHLGWRWFLERSPARVAERVYRRRATAFADAGARRELLEPEWLAAAGWDPREATRRHARRDGSPAWWAGHRFDLIERQRRFIQFGPHLLRPFVDVRTPFYAPALVELLWHARASALFEQRAYRRMHARWLPALAAVPEAGRDLPLSAGTPRRMARRVLDAGRLRLPGALRGEPDARSPTAYAEWFRGPLRGFLGERLLDGHAAVAGVVRRAAVERLLAEHVSGAADHTPRLGVLLSLTAWLHGVGGAGS